MADTPMHAAMKFHRAADKLSSSAEAGERKAAVFVAGVIKSGSPARLRNVGKKGAALGVRVTPATGSGVLVAASGPWPIIEHDTPEHYIGEGRGKYRGTKRQYLRFPSGEIRLGPIRHPGTKGKHLFRKGVEEARPAVPRIIDAEVKLALRTTFGF